MENKIKLARLLRKDQTEAEKMLWKHLRNRSFNHLKFRRQHPIKQYIVDFCCLKKRIIIELDGKQHLRPEHKEKDELRDLHLKNLGYSILRFPNEIIFKNPEFIFKSILETSKKTIPEDFQQSEEKRSNSLPHPNLLPQGRRSGRKSASILSTKKLARHQKELLLNAGHSVVEKNLISIVPLDFEVTPLPDNIIFTSKNAVKMVLDKGHDLQNKSIFCVGDKTTAFLKAHGFPVMVTANYGYELAEKIASTYSNENFIFFCGKKRRIELPDYLKEKGVALKEVEVYDTHLVEKKIDRTFDGVLFFSPSAVRSFCAVNNISGSIAFCIGNTTASEAKNFTDDIIVATKPSIENVIVQVVKHFQ